MIPGWELALRTMQNNEIAEVRGEGREDGRGREREAQTFRESHHAEVTGGWGE